MLFAALFKLPVAILRNLKFIGLFKRIEHLWNVLKVTKYVAGEKSLSLVSFVWLPPNTLILFSITLSTAADKVILNIFENSFAFSTIANTSVLFASAACLAFILIAFNC